MRIPAGLIEGIEAYGSAQVWDPDIPTVDIMGTTAGVTNDITTISVFKKNELKDLKFRCPVDIIDANGIPLQKGKYYVTNQLDSVKSFTLNEKDTTYPFAYIVYYNYYSDTIGILQGNADALVPRVPTLPLNCILIDARTEPKQGDTYPPPQPPSPKIIYATFQELTNLKAANQIVAGQFYEMTDYCTTHEINDSTNTGTTNIHIEDVEPLLLLGLNSNEFHAQVYSKQFPKDIIHYDITNVLCEDGSTPRPGIITYRKDEWENETHFDFRGTKVYDGANNVYVFANSRNPGSSSFYGNKIGINSTYNNYFLFGIDCNSNTLGDDCYSNILGDGCNSNTLGDNCYSNTLGDDCDSNTFGNECGSNTLGDNCGSTTFGNECGSNTFGNECGSNTLGDNCDSNTLGDNCGSNTFGNECSSNTLGNVCSSNTLGNGCSSNTLGNVCYSIVPDTGNTAAILNTTFENGVSNITYLATATHLYANYHKVVFKYPDGTRKLRYYDNAGALQVVDVNA